VASTELLILGVGMLFAFCLLWHHHAVYRLETRCWLVESRLARLEHTYIRDHDVASVSAPAPDTNNRLHELN